MPGLGTLAGTALLLSCGDGGTEPPAPEPPRATTVAVTPATVELTGATVRLSAQVLDQNGQAMAGAAVAWSSSDVAVAMVDGAGLVTGVATGTAVIEATSGTAAGSATVRVVPTVSVAFAEDSVRVVEGQEVAVGIRYRIGELDSALPIQVSVRDEDAEAEDYELSETGLEIPAGTSAEGTLDFVVSARTDYAFAEGDERLALQLVAPDANRVEVGGPLAVAIADAAVTACQGVTLRATPPEPAGAEGQVVSITSEWLQAADRVAMEWLGPYGTPIPGKEHHPNFQRGIVRPTRPSFHLADWRIEPAAGTVRHAMMIEWPKDAELALRFRSTSESCGGEPVARCRSDGCVLTR